MTSTKGIINMLQGDSNAPICIVLSVKMSQHTTISTIVTKNFATVCGHLQQTDCVSYLFLKELSLTAGLLGQQFSLGLLLLFLL